MRYTKGQPRGDNLAPRTQERRHIVQKSNINIIQSKLFRHTTARTCTTHIQEETGYLESRMAKQVTAQSHVEKKIDEYYGDLTTACNETFRSQLAPKR